MVARGTVMIVRLYASKREAFVSLKQITGCLLEEGLILLWVQEVSSTSRIAGFGSINGTLASYKRKLHLRNKAYVLSKNLLYPAYKSHVHNKLYEIALASSTHQITKYSRVSGSAMISELLDGFVINLRLENSTSCITRSWTRYTR